MRIVSSDKKLEWPGVGEIDVRVSTIRPTWVLEIVQYGIRTGTGAKNRRMQL